MVLTEIASGRGPHGDEEALVDIVAIHGLNPFNNRDHALDTWREPQNKAGKLWLQDYLPERTPNARIFLYKYNSNAVFSASKERFVFAANDLLGDIYHARKTDPTRPLILVAHSLGGILVKQALVNAHNNPKFLELKEATSALVFFGTPHTGGKASLVTLGKISIRIVRGLIRDPPNDLMQAVTKGSLYADVLEENWRHQLNSFKIVSFYEGVGDIVPRDSATFRLPGNVEDIVRLDADHSKMCRFDLGIETDRENYDKVQAYVGDLYEFALTRPSLHITENRRATSNNEGEPRS